jgi:hypothetical protein
MLFAAARWSAIDPGCVKPRKRENAENRLSQIDQNRPRIRIIATKFAIGKMIHSIGSPHRRVFTQPRPEAVIGGPILL